MPLTYVSLDASEVDEERRYLEAELGGSDGVVVKCYNAKTEADIPEEVERADVVAVWHTIWCLSPLSRLPPARLTVGRLTPQLLARLKRCRAVVRMGVGYDNGAVRARLRGGGD